MLTPFYFNVLRNVWTNDPLFVDAANGNYQLQAASPCRNAGTNYTLSALAPNDLSGNPRIRESIATWLVSTNRVYDLDDATSLPTADWMPVEGMTGMVFETECLSIINPVGNESNRAYRLRVRLP